MALITTIEQYRKYVKIAASSTTAVVLPDFNVAENKHLVPILGYPLYNALNENIAAPDYARLLDLSRAVIAPMAMYYHLPFIQANITDTGIKTMSTDEMQAAPKWVNRDLREGLLDNASYAAEGLLNYLVNLPANSALVWDNPPLKTALFKTGDEFNQYHSLHQPQRTLLQLIPAINAVEDLYIRPAFGEDFYDAFKAAVNNATEEKKLLELIRKAVANLAVSHAIESLSVKITPFGFTIKMTEDIDDPYRSQQHATDRQLETKRLSTLETGKTYLDQAIAFINAKASAELFATFFNSELYIAPGTQPPPDMNESFTGIFVL